MNEIISAQFASRFSLEDWQLLCTKQNFCDAVKREDFEAAECIAFFELTQVDTKVMQAAASAAIHSELKHAQICDFVRIWAKHTNRTGTKHKQSRQCRIRKLMKHGLNSAYARALAVEARLN